MNKLQIDKIKELLVANRSGQFSFLSALVRQRSENPPGGFERVTAHLTEQFRKLGFKVQRFPESGEVGDTGIAGITNLVIRHEFGDGPTIALAAHVDTAIAGPDWTKEAFGGEIIERHIYGRGVAGAKGALAAYVFALVALRECGEDLVGAIELHITFDGEIGGDLGPRWLLANGHVAPDMAIAVGTTHSLITSASGRLCLEVEINGRSAPASDPEAGIDTIDAAAKVMTAIYGLKDEYAKISSKINGIEHPTVIVTEVHGGDSPRHVASTTTVKLDRRLIPEEDPVTVERDLTTLIGKAVVMVDKMLCKVRRTYVTPAMVAVDGTDNLIEAFQRHAADVFGNNLPVLGTAKETDGRHYTNAGIPTVLYGVGPSDPAISTIAGPDEVLALDDLRGSTEMLAFALFEVLSKEADR
jgi:succinyl-diaminopimelate desuccinylase